MPTLTIEGRRVKVDDSFLSLSPEQQAQTVDEIAGQLGITPGQSQQDTASETPESQQSMEARQQLSAVTQNPHEAIQNQHIEDQKAARDKFYSSGIYAGAYNPLGPIGKALGAGADMVGSGILMNFDDEIGAGLGTGFGTMGDYGAARAKLDAHKAADREQNPVASAIGEVAGGATAAGTLAKGGLTVAGRALPVIGRTGAAAIEGGAYGAANGAGDAAPGRRLEAAGWGAALGAGTGAAVSKFGDVIASKLATKSAQAAAPSIDDLAAQADTLYKAADQAGIVFKPNTTNKLAANMQIAAGNINRDLRPNTAGVVDDVMTMANKPMTLQQFDELRQTVGLAMKNAQPQDVRTLQRMKVIIDAAAENATAADVTGNIDGLKAIKEARNIWARKSKAELIADYMDLADVNSGKYSQSGISNAIRQKSEQLYKRIVAGKEKGFTSEEIALIRQMAKGEMTSKAVQWLSKFAPRGVVSAAGGSSIGATIGGAVGGIPGAAVGAAVPGAVGFGAAKVTDRAAMRGMQALQAAAASGNAPVINAITNKTVPFIGTLGGQMASQTLQRALPSR